MSASLATPQRAQSDLDAYPPGMELVTTWPWSTLIGVAVGALAVGLVWVLRYPWSQSSRLEQVVVPDGLDTALDVIGTTGLVLGSDDQVIRASRTALELGIVDGREVNSEPIRELVAAARQAGHSVQDEIELRHSDGRTIPVLVRVAPLGSQFILLVAEDRSDMYRIDSVRRDFIANISHELKTPIGAVSLLAEALGYSADEPDQVRRFAASLEKEANRLAELTGDIIELSRLQSLGTLEDGEALDIDEVVRSAVDANQLYAEAHDIELVVNAKSKALVRGDRGSLVTAVHNLVRNAISYSDGAGRVGIGVVRRDNRVEISVTDQGVGIPAEELGRVFERFYRGDPARSRQTGGTGLGLSIVKHVVQNHRGEVRVWSHPGRGSTFTIKLRVAEDVDLPATPTEVSGASAQSPAARSQSQRPSEFIATPALSELDNERSEPERESA